MLGRGVRMECARRGMTEEREEDDNKRTLTTKFQNCAEL